MKWANIAGAPRLLASLALRLTTRLPWEPEALVREWPEYPSRGTCIRALHHHAVKQRHGGSEEAGSAAAGRPAPGDRWTRPGEMLQRFVEQITAHSVSRFISHFYYLYQGLAGLSMDFTRFPGSYRARACGERPPLARPLLSAGRRPLRELPLAHRLDRSGRLVV